MANEQIATQQDLGVKSFFGREDVQKKFAEIMGKNSTSFIASVLQIATSNELLKSADSMSIYQSAMVAATLNLPLNNSLGQAYIIPFNDRKTGKVLAQFQIGYKGMIQLALRSGQFKTVSATPIYKGQLIAENPLTGYEFDFTNKESQDVIGYAGYFKLINGFEKTLYMSVEDLKRHCLKFSQTFKKGFGLWKDDFDSMAIKTVLKLLISKYAPLSVDMQKAVIFDQSIVTDADNNEAKYVDNEPQFEDLEIISEKKEGKRIEDFINNAQSRKQLQDGINGIELTQAQKELYNAKMDSYGND